MSPTVIVGELGCCYCPWWRGTGAAGNRRRPAIDVVALKDKGAGKDGYGSGKGVVPAEGQRAGFVFDDAGGSAAVGDRGGNRQFGGGIGAGIDVERARGPAQTQAASAVLEIVAPAGLLVES